MAIAAFIASLLAPAVASAGETSPAFNADRAFADIEAQCAFGSRIPGTEAHLAGRDWIVDRLREVGYHVWLQHFEDRNPLTGEDVDAWNIWGIPAGWGPAESEARSGTGRISSANPPALAAKPDSFILLSAHWDTRPWADEEEPPRDRSPLLGANDGGSGVAVALEVARSLKGTELDGRVALVFYDLEDSGLHGETESWSRGAQFALSHLPPWFSRLRLGVNLDMVAGEDLILRREGHGTRVAPGPTRRLWTLGRKLAPDVFISEPRRGVIDDHYFFTLQGWPYIDLIGMPYRYWHRVGDTPAHCSRKSMAAVGTVLIEFIGAEFGH